MLLHIGSLDATEINQYFDLRLPKKTFSDLSQGNITDYVSNLTVTQSELQETDMAQVTPCDLKMFYLWNGFNSSQHWLCTHLNIVYLC